MRERIVVVIATAEGSSNEREHILKIETKCKPTVNSTFAAWGRTDTQSNTPGYRASITDQYRTFRYNKSTRNTRCLGAQLMLVTIGQPLFPMFQYVAPADETVSIASFEVR